MDAVSPDKLKVKQDFLAFYADPERKEFRIGGKAGTGKSYLINLLVEACQNQTKLLRQLNTGNTGAITKAGVLANIDVMHPDYTMRDGYYQPNHVYVTAPTGSAVRELSKQCRGTLPHSQITTIHSLIGVRPARFGNNSEMVLTRNSDEHTVVNSLIIIDEASYITEELLHLLYTCTENCKLVFVGDRCQLLGVGETYSAVFNTDKLDGLITKGFRSTEPEILELRDDLYDSVDLGDPISIKPNGRNIIHISDDVKMAAIMRLEYAKEDQTCTSIAWFNTTVTNMNQFHRKNRGYPEEFTAGETVVTTKRCMSLDNDSRSKQVMIGLDTEIVVTDVISYAEFQARFPTSIVNIPYTNVKVLVGIVPAWGGDQVALALPLDIEHVNRAALDSKRDNDWQLLTFFRDTMGRVGSWEASTVYKAQGRTVDVVFVDARDIGSAPSPDLIKRMIYVACTRARYKVYIYGDVA